MFKNEKETSENPFENKESKEELAQEDNSETATDDNAVSDENKENEAQKLKTELEDLNNRYIRLHADFDNFRKRQAQERESLLKYGASETLKKILPVLDNIERARKSCIDMEDPIKLKENFEVIIKNLSEALEKCGLQKIEAEGLEFNPNLHEAVSQIPTNEYSENIIISEMQSGYKLGDSLLRPSLVSVAVKPNEG